MEVSWEAMEHAGVRTGAVGGPSGGRVCGHQQANDYSQHLLQRPETDIDAYLATGNSHSVAAGRLSLQFRLDRPQSGGGYGLLVRRLVAVPSGLPEPA